MSQLDQRGCPTATRAAGPFPKQFFGPTRSANSNAQLCAFAPVPVCHVPAWRTHAGRTRLVTSTSGSRIRGDAFLHPATRIPKLSRVSLAVAHAKRLAFVEHSGQDWEEHCVREAKRYFQNSDENAFPSDFKLLLKGLVVVVVIIMISKVGTSSSPLYKAQSTPITRK